MNAAALLRRATDGFRPVLEVAGRLSADRSLSVRWSPEWTPEFDRFLDELPELPDCPHDVFRVLAADTGVRKLHASVEEDGRPIAMVSLRRRPQFWEPVTYDVVPTGILPCTEGNLGRVLRGLGREVRIEGYRGDPTQLGPRASTAFPRYAIDLKGNYERHWRKKGRMSSINKARRDNERLQLRVDHAPDVAWTVDTWVRQWADHPRGEVVSAPDRKRVWAERLEAGSIRSLALVDRGQVVAGNVVHVGGGTAVGLCMARLEGRGASIGTRLLDASTHWLADEGLEIYDIGGGLAYKRWWGPEAGQMHWMSFRPLALEVGQRLGKRATSVVGPDGSADD